MTVRHEIKSQLAKLLATEDLVVEHKQVETACFNVHTRVLTLPQWERASNVVYDMLVGHEVGHALYTPDRDWIEEKKISPQIVNVVEDVRIEKLMKRRYAGLAKTFYNGYKELADEDFFALENENIGAMNLADRANLYFKIGNFVDIPFHNVQESNIIKMIADCETFDDVLEAAQRMHEYCSQKNTENEPQQQNNTTESSGNSSQSGDNTQTSPKMDSEETNEESEEKSESSDLPEPVSEGGGGVSNQDNLDVKTMESLEESIKNLIENNGFDSVYVEIPKLNLSKIIIPNSEIHDGCKTQWSDFPLECFEKVDGDFKKFKKSSQKEVNYLVKEFECRKSADAYARSSESRTGVLNTGKLHTYRFNEDLFKKVTVVPDGKNHGLVFLLDWSGSMGTVMLDTLKQLYNLMWFCKKVNIPFEVYAFTSDYPIVKDVDGESQVRVRPYQLKEGVVSIGEWFSLMNIFTSKVKSSVLDEQMKNIFRIACCFSNINYYPSYPVPVGMSLSGTPLNESLVALHEILPKFKKEHNLQKTHCVILTDGEGAPLKYHKVFDRRWEDEPFIGVANFGPNSFIRDRKMGTTYSLDCEWYEFTDVLLRNLRDKFKDMSFIGIRVLEPRDGNSFIRRYTGYGSKFDVMSSIWKKTKTICIKSSGYHTYFGMSANILSTDSSFSVADSATKTQIKSAFAKSLKSKKMNKKVLTEFVELIS